MMDVRTRRQARQLEYSHPYEKMSADGRRKVYEEVFINPGGEMTAALASRHLDAIRQQHSTRYGWHCASGHEGVFKDDDGKWYAFRHHAQYK